MYRLSKKYISESDGNFGIIFAVVSTILLMLIGVAIDISSAQSHYSKSQDIADIGSLAVAKYMSENMSSTDSRYDFEKHKRKAKKHADQIISNYMDQSVFVKSTSRYNITKEQAQVTLKLETKTLFMGMFGKQTLPIEVSSTSILAQEGSKDLDLVLMTDATGSMMNQLMGIQQNMKDFTSDLQSELDSSNLELGRVRVKFIFFRDYMVDNDRRWTSRHMDLQSGLESFGPMYESKFFELPHDKSKMDDYVDFFNADGGGSFRESGLEAVAHALKAKGWGSGENTVRSLVLWTDATPRPLGDTVEDFALMPVTDPLDEPFYYFNSAYWDEHIGPHFTAMNQEQREDYMINKFYPNREIPSSLSKIKSKLEKFHEENSNGKENVTTFNLNIVSDCWGTIPCGEWEEFKNWEGVNVIEDGDSVSATETYNKIIIQVAETVRSQVAARDIAIIN